MYTFEAMLGHDWSLSTESFRILSPRLTNTKFDELTACFCEVHINAGSSVNLDVELLWNPLQFLVENNESVVVFFHLFPKKD